MRRFALLVGFVVALGLGATPSAFAADPEASRDARLGVAALCIGGGQGIAMVVERAEGAPGG